MHSACAAQLAAWHGSVVHLKSPRQFLTQFSSSHSMRPWWQHAAVLTWPQHLPGCIVASSWPKSPLCFLIEPEPSTPNCCEPEYPSCAFGSGHSHSYPPSVLTHTADESQLCTHPGSSPVHSFVSATWKSTSMHSEKRWPSSGRSISISAWMCRQPVRWPRMSLPL